MAYFRVNKNRDYTVMSNHHLRDRNLSLRAIGLLSKMLSLPDDWDYSVPGLVAICQESKNIIQGALKELEKNGYLVRTMTRDSSGHIGYNYDVYEQPQHTLPRPEKPFTVEPCTVSPSTVEPCTEKQPQLSTNRLSTNKLSTEESKTQEKAVEPNVVNIEAQPKEQTTDCDGLAKVIQFYQENSGYYQPQQNRQNNGNDVVAHWRQVMADVCQRLGTDQKTVMNAIKQVIAESTRYKNYANWSDAAKRNAEIAIMRNLVEENM